MWRRSDKVFLFQPHQKLHFTPEIYEVQRNRRPLYRQLKMHPQYNIFSRMESTSFVIASTPINSCRTLSLLYFPSVRLITYATNGLSPRGRENIT